MPKARFPRKEAFVPFSALVKLGLLPDARADGRGGEEGGKRVEDQRGNSQRFCGWNFEEERASERTNALPKMLVFRISHYPLADVSSSSPSSSLPPTAAAAASPASIRFVCLPNCLSRWEEAFCLIKFRPTRLPRDTRGSPRVVIKMAKPHTTPKCPSLPKSESASRCMASHRVSGRAAFPEGMPIKAPRRQTEAKTHASEPRRRRRTRRERPQGWRRASVAGVRSSDSHTPTRARSGRSEKVLRVSN